MVSSLRRINLPVYTARATRREMVLAVSHMSTILAGCRCAGEAIIPVIMPMGLILKVVQLLEAGNLGNGN